MSLVVSFPGSGPARPADVGGKGHSLIRMAEAGLPVPPGAVLTTGFFAPWLDELRGSARLRSLAAATPDEQASLCEELKRLARARVASEEQRRALAELREHLPAGAWFAVRSSSPEEDLASASFAGGYETRLGVRANELEAAVRSCFASAFDERVLVYKRERGLDPLAPRMAVVVQQQIASDVAGVAFSLDPVTNDYDEAVIDANWGLGESVVSGLASPDHFVVDKPSGRIVERTLGAKERSLWLGPDGGTVEREGHRSGEPCLSEVQVSELVRVLCRIEELYEGPVDVEWAYAGVALHVLQARPVTTWVPLPPEMQTRPGEPRRLYSDAALAKGLTTNAPISPLGLSWFQEGLYGRLLGWMGLDDFTPAGGMVFAAGCRFYMNVSDLMWLRVSPKLMARNIAQTDALLAETLAGVDAERYRPRSRPAWLRMRLLLSLPRTLWELRGFLRSLLRNFLAPERGRRAYQREVAAFEALMEERLDYDLPLREFARRYAALYLDDILDVTLPAVIAGLVSPAFLIPRRAREERALGDALRRGHTGNLVVEQGITLYRLARRLEPADFDDLDALAERIAKRQLPAAFLAEWDAFVERFGCRGPNEMDPRSPRYADDPTLALQQMSYMAGDGGFDPAAAHRRNVEERRRAYEALLARFGWLRRALLRYVYALIERFAGTRDTPKYHVVLLTWAIRKRALLEGRRLVAAGRLDAPEQVFDLTVDELEAAARDPGLDLRRLREERTRFAKRVAHVTAFPQLIDSRGRIPRPPPREGRPGELVGTPVSPGSVTGPVVVLHDPREKPVAPGDVLVAYTTDPGWTPLFVNAAAVVLEVGGVLQHGAVIAREYGKPCVAGVDRVVAKLRDGQRVEVDGSAGVIRILSGGDEATA